MMKYMAYVKEGLYFSVPAALGSYIAVYCRNDILTVVSYLVVFILISGPLFILLNKKLARKHT